MTDRDAQLAMVAVIRDWAHGALSTEEFVSQYWKTRNRLLDSNVNAFAAPFGGILSPMDAATDSYSADPERLHIEIDEEQLRTEANQVINNLRAAGYWSD